jgi:hypothetical protein
MAGLNASIKDRGYTKVAIYNMVDALVTNLNGVLTKLDADGLGDTNYLATLGITTPTIGNTYGKTVRPDGYLQSDIVSLCKQIRTNFNALEDKLAADGVITGTTIYTNLKFSTTQRLIDTYNAKVKPQGINQGDFSHFFNDVVDKFNYTLSLLDTDAACDKDYHSTFAIIDVVEVQSSSSSCRSSSSSCKSSSSSCRSSSSSSSCRSSSSSSSSKSSSSSSSSKSSSSSSSSKASISSSSSCRSSSSSCRSSSSSSSSSTSSSSSAAGG